MRRYPKVKVDRNGMAVLSGIHIRDLKSIFTAASIHHYDTEADYREGGKRHQEAVEERLENKFGLGDVSWTNYLKDLLWVRRIRLLIKSVDSPPYNHGYDNIPVSQLDKSGRFCRLRAAHQQRNTRLHIEKIMAEIWSKKS